MFDLGKVSVETKAKKTFAGPDPNPSDPRLFVQ
jgi:hypothetical protein